MTIKTWRFISAILFLALTIVGILFVLHQEPSEPDKNFWPIGIALGLGLANLVTSLLVGAPWRTKKVVLITLLSLITLGCLIGAAVLASISTMFGGSVGDQIGWTYYLWFIVPIALWAGFIFYLVSRRR